MNSLSWFLKVIFSPLTIIAKIWEEDDLYILATISLVFWFIFLMVGWGYVAVTASALFSIVTGVASYLFTLFFYFKIPYLDLKGASFMIFILTLVIAAIAGYTFGLAGYVLFLLW